MFGRGNQDLCNKKRLAMQQVIIWVPALACLITLIALAVVRIKLKRAEKKLELDRKACFFLCGYSTEEKKQELEHINDIFVQIACDDTQITTDLVVVNRAAEMLIDELKQKEKQPYLE